MTVKELIKELEKMPQEATVGSIDYDSYEGDAYWEFTSVELADEEEEKSIARLKSGNVVIS